jgi:hypothetical protein
MAGSAGGGRPRRISVVGATGSGKSYLSRILSARLQLPLYELDALRGELSAAEFTSAVAALAARNEWIIDGHYRDVRRLVWNRADTVLWLNYPLSLVAVQLLRRFRENRPSREGAGMEARAPGRPAVPSRAGWARRLRRLARTLRERGEFRRLLRDGGFGNALVVELDSPDAAARWVSVHSGG